LKNSFTIALLAAALAACSVNKTGGSPPGAIGESAKLIGIWKMLPLGVGIANVVEFSAAGESRLHSYNCITKDQQAPEISHYEVGQGGRTIQLVETNGTSQTLKILFISEALLVLSQSVGGEHLNFQYTRGSDLAPLCGPDERWEEERAKRVPYARSDFVPDPAIPPHPDMARYAGRWANEKGEVQIEVKRLADGSYQLNHNANENWTYLFNAVHWKGHELHYKSFAYANRSDLFDHPYHKSSHESFIAPEPNGASMKYAFFIGGKKYEYVLSRK